MEKKDGKTKLIQDFNALGWLQVILGVICIVLAFTAFKSDQTYQVTLILITVLHFVVALLMFRGKKYALEGSKTAYTFGIITGVLLILTLDIIDIVLGILVLVDSGNYKSTISK